MSQNHEILRDKISRYKVSLLELKLLQAAGWGRPYDYVQAGALERLIFRYEAYLTALDD